MGRAKLRSCYRTGALMALLAIVAVLVTAPAADASQLVHNNAKKVRLKVNRKGVAQVTYTAGGKRHDVLFWGAVGAQKKFRLDRTGGWKSKKADWRNPGSFRNACRKYRGPALTRATGGSMRHAVSRLVAVCTHPDGSHWALQSWKRLVRHQGTGAYATAPRELRISHWRGSYGTLSANANWVGGGTRMQLYGQLKWKGKPWFATAWGTTGNVTDGVGRNMFIDSYNSDFGTGWWRVNSILTHRPSGQYCYNFGPKPPVTDNWGYSPEKRYRLGVPGPGVSPDIFLSVTGVTYAEYDPAVDDVHDQAIRDLLGVDPPDDAGCKTNN
jgi:hypothetical protein